MKRTFDTMSRSIRAKCLDCAAGDSGEVRRCVCFACPLWAHRLGFDPDRQSPHGREARRWVQAWNEAADAARAANVVRTPPDHPLMKTPIDGSTGGAGISALPRSADRS